MNSDLLSSSEIHPSMKAVLGAVEGWGAQDVVLLRVGIFLRKGSAIVEVKERETLRVFGNFEKRRGSWVLKVRKECSSDQNGEYREVSPTTIYTYFNANLAVATTSFWIY